MQQALPGRTVAIRVPGDGILHPVAVAAIALLILNDHVLKQAYPGLITGKLSDFAGLVFFPIFLAGTLEVVASAVRRHPVISRPSLALAASFATAVVFAAIKLWPAANGAASSLLGDLQGLTSLTPGHATPLSLDPTDLIALPCAFVGVFLAARRTQCED